MSSIRKLLFSILIIFWTWLFHEKCFTKFCQFLFQFLKHQILVKLQKSSSFLSRLFSSQFFEATTKKTWPKRISPQTAKCLTFFIKSTGNKCPVHVQTSSLLAGSVLIWFLGKWHQNPTDIELDKNFSWLHISLMHIALFLSWGTAKTSGIWEK